MAAVVRVPVSLAELFDKISILQIKKERMGDKSKIQNVNFELQLLCDVARSLPDLGPESTMLCRELKEVNEQIWDAEEDIRTLARQQRFDTDFISVARSIYIANDRRAMIKRQLNLVTGSALMEEKSHS